MTPGPDPSLIPAIKLVAIVRAFEASEIPYAVGGAPATCYWSEPRGTTDLDFNIFAPEAAAGETFGVLAALGVVAPEGAVATVAKTGQVRTLWDDTYVDLFFAYDELHDEAQRRAVRVPFGVEPDRVLMLILGAEHCVMFKVLFNRPKDWPDIENVLRTSFKIFDFSYTAAWLERALGAEDRALARLRDLWAEVSADNAPRA